MAETFREIQDLIPRKSFLIMTAALAATAAFMLICTFIESLGMPIWAFPAAAAIFAIMIIFCFFVKLKILIADDTIRIRFLKEYVIGFEEVIDYKVGDLNIMRNYSGWGIKKVTFKNLICVGYDNGISLKLTGRRIMTISLSDPEAFASLLPQPEQNRL